MNNVRFKCLHVWYSSRSFSADFFTPLGVIETKIELPREFVKEIESKAVEAFMEMLKEKQNVLS